MNKTLVGYGIGVLIFGAIVVILAEVYLSPTAICPCSPPSSGQTVSCSCPNITPNFPFILVGLIISLVGIIITSIGLMRN